MPAALDGVRSPVADSQRAAETHGRVPPVRYEGRKRRKKEVPPCVHLSHLVLVVWEVRECSEERLPQQDHGLGRAEGGGEERRFVDPGLEQRELREPLHLALSLSLEFCESESAIGTVCLLAQGPFVVFHIF